MKTKKQIRKTIAALILNSLSMVGLSKDEAQIKSPEFKMDSTINNCESIRSFNATINN